MIGINCSSPVWWRKKCCDSSLHVGSSRTNHGPIQVCGRDQPGHGRQKREAGVRAAGQNLLSCVQRSVFLANTQVVDWPQIQSQDELVDCLQRTSHVSLHGLEHGGVSKLD